jgi:hypothetical protein
VGRGFPPLEIRESRCTVKDSIALGAILNASRGVSDRNTIVARSAPNRARPNRGVYSGAAPTGGPPGGRCMKVRDAKAPSHDPNAAKAT